MDYILETQNLCKQYGRFKALDGLNMHVPKGSIYGFVGRNGAGKTTLIRLICGLQTPTSGSYTLYGISSGNREIASVRSRMGAMIEAPSIYRDMSAAENLRMQRRILGHDSCEGIQELLKLVGLENAGRKKARNFSLGMKQRLGIAMALAGYPDFLVLDEPTNGMDPQGIIEMRNLILKLNREMGVTILISSHALDELSRLATHYGFIRSGCIVQEISAKELEARRSKCMRAETTNMDALERVLHRLGMEYRILSDREAEIYAELSLSRLVKDMEAEGGEILSLREVDEGLEAYFLSLEGGD